MMTGVFSFYRRKRLCRINQDDPAAIPDVRNSLFRVRSFVLFIWNGAVTACAAALLPVDTMAAGKKPDRCF